MTTSWANGIGGIRAATRMVSEVRAVSLGRAAFGRDLFGARILRRSPHPSCFAGAKHLGCGLRRRILAPKRSRPKAARPSETARTSETMRVAARIPPMPLAHDVVIVGGVMVGLYLLTGVRALLG